MKICIIIPTYCEYENLKKMIPLLYETIYSKMPEVEWSTLVVDDTSPDGTRKLLTHFKKRYPSLFTSYADKRGIGSAMKRGYRYALKKLQPDYIITLEADFIVDPKIIIPLVKKAKLYHIVLASRSNESEYYAKNYIRRWMHMIANDLICKHIGGLTTIKEHTAACRVVKVKGILDTLDLHSLPDGYAFFGSILFLLSRETNSFYEYKTPFFERGNGVSKVRFTFKNLLSETIDYLTFAIRHRFHTFCQTFDLLYL